VTHVPIDWGSRALPNEGIRNAQRDMGGVAADGVYGPKTQKRGEALLAQSFPERPAGAGTLRGKAAAALPSSSSSAIPSHAVQVLESGAPADALHAVPRMPASSAAPRGAAARVNAPEDGPHPLSPPGGTDAAPLPSPPFAPPARSPREAARALLNYVQPLVRAGRLAELGSKEAPNDTIANAQRDMRGIASDGVYGPRTAARGKELLGVAFPSRSGVKRRVSPAAPPPPPAPDSLATMSLQRAPQEAAAELYELVTHPPIQWGTRAQPNEQIRRLQLELQRLTADGVYGPKTQARAAALLRQAFPARPKGAS
jgi:hypothetical protein